ncbi:unnamed protein product [Fusarium venenatum]|uniref:Uncharacterized protein n=1 Tax=Fusarium venenatum TaxID=56646 RepID=A0A2L2SUC6_9HYPO|nr:uncharacterized protein FVRRES_05468 [Fusarium venenatum]CEI61032.1 unnamed protein product [Fusarium venenatum]
MVIYTVAKRATGFSIPERMKRKEENKQTNKRRPVPCTVPSAALVDISLSEPFPFNNIPSNAMQSLSVQMKNPMLQSSRMQNVTRGDRSSIFRAPTFPAFPE